MLAKFVKTIAELNAKEAFWLDGKRMPSWNYAQTGLNNMLANFSLREQNNISCTLEIIHFTKTLILSNKSIKHCAITVVQIS